MSHVSQIDIEIKDLTALQAACARLGLIWKANQSSYKWYGRWVGDYPLPENVKVKDLGKCLHAIEVPGARYEVGVTEVNGKLTLLWDFYSSGGLEQILGNNGGKLIQAYAVEATKAQARRAGMRAYEQVEQDGTIRLELRRME